MDDLSKRQGEIVREFLPQISPRDKVEGVIERAMVPIVAILTAGWIVSDPQAWPYALAVTVLFAILCLRLWRFRRPMQFVFRLDGERLECVHGSVPLAAIDHPSGANLKMVGAFGESVANPSPKGLCLLVLSHKGQHLEISPRSHAELVDWILEAKATAAPANPH